MKFLKEFIKWFVIINTGIVMVLFFNTLKVEALPTAILWEIFAASGATSLVTALLFSYEPERLITKGMWVAILFAHYVCLLVIMIVLGHAFGWISLTGHGILVMVLSVAAVYLCSTLLAWALSANEAKKMNEALKNIRD